MDALILAGAVTAIGTAVLTVASVWKLLLNPILGAVKNVEASVSRLEAKVDTMDSRFQADIKDVWRHLAERHVETK